MEKILVNGNLCHTYGSLPTVGSIASCFRLVDSNMKEITCADFEGKNIILNIFPSLDTSVCAMSVRKFNKIAETAKDTQMICVSMDLPFAAKRFCTTEGINNLVVASAFRFPLFAQKYGVQIVDGVLTGLLARAVIIMDKSRKVIYTELVEEITHEPNYEQVVKLIATL
ncbi:MAG: thiol peroxidase [Muribaculaceae bacterium]|nr:thiol peroxidase [Muribaculaceae bacterium]